MNFTFNQKFYMHFVKRPMGFLMALLLIILLSPIFIATIVLLYFANKGAGVFFTQDRPGKNEQIFKALKFKTMTDEKDLDGKLLPDADRLTPVGKFIRTTSIDELPQLINILKGDMALIGPRPALTYHPWPYEQYTEHQKHMFDVLPGITGWAQVNGYRGDTSIRKRIECDLYYIENWTVGLDIKIMFMTIFKGFINKNAY